MAMTLFFHAAHLVSTSTTTAVITSTLINLGIIAESLNPYRNTIIVKAASLAVYMACFLP